MTERFYRLAGRLLPRAFRDRWSADMADLLRWRLERAGGPFARSGVWMRATLDVVRTAISVRRGGGGEGPRRHRPGTGDVSRDIGYALRSLRATPSFTATAVVTLGLGIGAVVATFSILHAVLLRPLPWPEPEELVAVWPAANFNAAMVRRAEEAIPALEGISGISNWTLLLRDAAEPMEVNAARVTPKHFDLLRVRPILGRTFHPDESDPASSDVIVLSHGLWIRAFGGDPDVVGRRIRISGAEHDVREVIGVLPDDFRPVHRSPDAWVPIASTPGIGLADDDSWWVNWRVARLAPGATLDQASVQLEAFARTMRNELPSVFDEAEVREATIEPLGDWIARDLALPLRLAFGAVSLVLLIACSNVSNLLLARADARSDQVAIRTAMGATRGGIVRLLLLESLVVGAAAAGLGALLAFGLVRGVLAFAPADLLLLVDVRVSRPALVLAVVLAVLTSLAAGLVPALRASHTDPAQALGSTRGRAGRREGRLAATLVTAQIALAMVVVTGSGLMLRSLSTLLSEDVGIETGGVLAFRTNPGDRPDVASLNDVYRRLLARFEADPAVEAVSAIHLLPGTTDNWSFPTYPEGHVYGENEAVTTTNFRYVWPGYFALMEIELLRGRALSAADDEDAESVVVVNRAFADRWWPGEDPVGRAVRVFTTDARPMRIVGVVGDVRQEGRGHDARPELYAPHLQAPWQIGQHLVVRFGDGETTPHAARVRALVSEVDPGIAVEDIASLDEVFGRSASRTRFMAVLLGGFGLLALGLGAVGVFGVTATAVGRRIPEFGVRRALGSTSGDIVRSAVLRAGRPVALGLAVGVALAWLAAGLLENLLYGIEPTDPATLLGVAATLLVTSLVAAFLPALRAGRVDPASVLNRG